MRAVKPRSLEEFVAQQPPRVRTLVKASRQAVLGAVPHATERFRAGWGIHGFNAPRYFAFIHVAEGEVRLGFEWGVAVEDDPDGLLSGDGTQVRYVVIDSVRRAKSGAVAAIIRQALDAALRTRR
jgi:hypothetical protein